MRKQIKRLGTWFASTGALAAPVLMAKAYVAVGYAATVRGASAGSGVAIGVFGVLHAAFEGALWGAMFGGPVGMAVGIFWGL